MKRSTDRIITSHAGSLTRPEDLRQLVLARDAGEPYDADLLDRRLRESVAEVVQTQIDHGIDVVNDGEFSKRGFSQYAQERLGGIEKREYRPGETQEPHDITARDRKDFPDYYVKLAQGQIRQNVTAVPRPAASPNLAGGANTPVFCVEPLQYVGQAAVATDIANLKAAIAGKRAAEDAFIPSIAVGTVEHWLWNRCYKSDEEMLYAVADAMHDEYRAITDAGLMLQLDDPDLADAWQIFPEMTVAEYRKYAELRVEALNYALRDSPESLVRFHVCWGSGHGPHKNDIPLRDLIDIMFKIKAECYSVEASNPRHDHEWKVFQDVKLPDGKSLMPGVIGHVTDVIEHPELVADRLVRYAKLVGRENVIAGTDCGLSRVHPEVCWAKCDAMAEGARLATRQLWGREG